MAEAIILAAGLGLRMRPLTEALPKPLIRVAGKCLIDYALDFTAAGGVGEAVVNISYKAEMMEAHLHGRTHPRVLLSREGQPLETGGGIAQALPLLQAVPFFSLNSDVIVMSGAQHPFRRLRAAWDDARMDALLLLHPVAQAIGYGAPGDFFLNADGSVKRRRAGKEAPYVFCGVQLLHPRLFKHRPALSAFSLNTLYNGGAGDDGTLPRVHALVHDGAWLHVGDAEGIAQAERALASMHD
ncbi:MAG: nucleotidyltransferase family protein [Alphaproteobacteria bacterium]|nr:nucleotidyltransferase family protein [Alphaproteobacteria bacterium]